MFVNFKINQSNQNQTQYHHHNQSSFEYFSKWTMYNGFVENKKDNMNFNNNNKINNTPELINKQETINYNLLKVRNRLLSKSLNISSTTSSVPTVSKYEIQPFLSFISYSNQTNHVSANNNKNHLENNNTNNNNDNRIKINNLINKTNDNNDSDDDIINDFNIINSNNNSNKNNIQLNPIKNYFIKKRKKSFKVSDFYRCRHSFLDGITDRVIKCNKAYTNRRKLERHIRDHHRPDLKKSTTQECSLNCMGCVEREKYLLKKEKERQLQEEHFRNEVVLVDIDY